MVYQHLVSHQVLITMNNDRAADLPATLIQAQRDYFCSDMYERKYKEGVFHTQWIEE